MCIHIKIMIISALILCLAAFSYCQNNCIVISKMEITSDDIPNGFDSYRILQLSDLHSKRFGKDQKRLVKKIIEADPDIIVVTGDMVDSRRYDDDVCIELFKQITSIASVFLVTGNHEAASNRFDEFSKKLIDTGVIVLRNEKRIIKAGCDEIELIGLDDPAFSGQDLTNNIKELKSKDPLIYSVLLSHRPELFDVYIDADIDLILSGHAHGGQIRLPFVGGLFAPGQGFFPKYSSGIYRANGFIMVVSRGLGNSLFPQRIFNRPEIVLVELTRKKE